MEKAKGLFETKMTQVEGDPHGDPEISVMTLRKQFHGDIEATSKGMLLSVVSGSGDSAGSVAMERVSGKIAGLRGSFLLQHSGTIMRGSPLVAATVIPDSGTDELQGLEGKMKINISEGRHSYDFEYSLRFQAE